jgi:transposase
MGRDRFDHSVDHSDNTKPVRLQRVKVITGVERRRNWPVSKKLEIVAKSEAEGAVVSEVARRHGIHPQQLFGWRAKLRKAEKAASSITASAAAKETCDRSQRGQHHRHRIYLALSCGVLSYFAN